jgi:uncharacterized protein (DUF2141 family)
MIRADARPCPGRRLAAAAAFLAALAPPAGVGAATLPIEGPDASACAVGAPSIVAIVSGFSTRTGHVRVQLYGSEPSDFLRKGKKLKRIDLPVTGDPMTICVAVPAPGTYALAVRHDRNGNGQSDLRDGAGFSRNPPIRGIAQPRHAEVAFTVGGEPREMRITLLYLRGLKAEPARPPAR